MEIKYNIIVLVLAVIRFINCTNDVTANIKSYPLNYNNQAQPPPQQIPQFLQPLPQYPPPQPPPQQQYKPPPQSNLQPLPQYPVQKPQTPPLYPSQSPPQYQTQPPPQYPSQPPHPPSIQSYSTSRSPVQPQYPPQQPQTHQPTLKPIPNSPPQYQPPQKPTLNYEYILPLRTVNSCPSFASFKFACQPNHLISIDSLTFAPVLLDSAGECMSDWSAECKDEGSALDYALKECSSRESCSLISYQLRSRTKCSYHQVISIQYKCIPTWEVVDVPVKCDICKNVTINSLIDNNYGFIHSAWYPKLYPRVTCHSLIRNKPDHMIVIYSVSGSIGLDRIQIETVNVFGSPVKEILTGNLTTRLVMSSAYDINVTVLTEDTYYYDHRRFLLYFYLVPKCQMLLCSNITGYPYVSAYPLTTAFFSHPPAYIGPSSDSYLPTTYAHFVKDPNLHVSKISDAWLAAILALIYALLMVFAVITAIYCRRRRRRRMLEQNKIIMSPSSVNSSSHIINPISRTHSHVSLREMTTTNDYNMPMNTIYMNTQNLNQGTMYSTVSHEQANYHHHHQQTFEESNGIEKRAMPIRQANYNEFDNYSQVVTEEDSFSGAGATGGAASVIMNYGDVDIQNNSSAVNQSSYAESYRLKQQQNSDINTMNYPFALKTNNQLGSIIASAAGMSHNSDSLRSIYRAVEYTKSPRLERVRVKNSEDLDQEEEYNATSNQMNSEEYSTRTSYKTESSNTQHVLESNMTMDDNSEKTFVVKLFPLDEQEKEVQEMTMFVESSDNNGNTSTTVKYSNYSNS